MLWSGPVKNAIRNLGVFVLMKWQQSFFHRLLHEEITISFPLPLPLILLAKDTLNPNSGSWLDVDHFGRHLSSTNVTRLPVWLDVLLLLALFFYRIDLLLFCHLLLSSFSLSLNYLLFYFSLCFPLFTIILFLSFSSMHFYIQFKFAWITFFFFNPFADTWKILLC